MGEFLTRKRLVAAALCASIGAGALTTGCSAADKIKKQLNGTSAPSADNESGPRTIHYCGLTPAGTAKQLGRTAKGVVAEVHNECNLGKAGGIYEKPDHESRLIEELPNGTRVTLECHTTGHFNNNVGGAKSYTWFRAEAPDGKVGLTSQAELGMIPTTGIKAC
jgi:hypothetical protein